MFFGQESFFPLFVYDSNMSHKKRRKTVENNIKSKIYRFEAEIATSNSRPTTEKRIKLYIKRFLIKNCNISA